MPRARGVTLLELLLAMTILGIALAVLVQYFIGGLRVTATITDQTRLQEELRTAGNIITDETQRALYIFPPGTKFNFTASGFNGLRNHLSNPATNTAEWTVGQSDAPILAMIVAPKDPSVSCAKFAEGCYEFVSYQPVKREYLVRGAQGNPSTSRSLLEPDGNNNDRWVLVEYRKTLTANLNPTNGQALAANNTQKDWAVTQGGQTVRVPRVPWAEVGCGGTSAITSQTCSSVIAQPPIPDLNLQRTPRAIPTICATAAPDLAIGHQKRVEATRTWLENNPGTARILFEYIKPTTGFVLTYTMAAQDKRGVSEIKLGLQASLKTRGTEVLLPGVPLEFYSSPRNLPGPTLQCSS